ncbi:MAG: ATP synthase F1 subunit gamma [Oscillospiraceae bacterium]|nr:ATP synthase F1 subunit gamma [Oscillospiraceae bacterium]
MANMRAIRTRIKSVQNTQQITKTMKMVAAANLRRTQSGMGGMRAFAEKTQTLLDTLLSGGETYDAPLLTPHDEVRKICYVLFVGNRGLCGMYNHALLRFLQKKLQDETREVSVIVYGRWGRDLMKQMQLPVEEVYQEVSDTPTMNQALVLAEALKRRFLSGDADEVHLVYQHFRSMLAQEPTDMRLLPASAQTKSDVSHEYLFEPDRASILENLLQLYVNNTVYSTMLEAKVGEHASRMTAMSAATDSTAELIGTLQLHLNRARQAAITTEISEIVGGANALKKSKKQS